MSHRDGVIAEALDRLALTDAAVAGDARAALDWLTAGEGLAELTQDRLQYFLWVQLSAKWLTGPEHHRRVVDALATAFDLMELPRYAALCRSATTAEVLSAHQRGRAEGMRAFRRADDASGLRPPDLPELVWGSVMGLHENRARAAVAEYLELAVASGDLRPGTRGWRRHQAELTLRHLRAPRHDPHSRSLLDLVRAERVEAWSGPRRCPARRRVLAPVAAGLDRETPFPTGIADPLPALRRLLARLAEGQALPTPAGPVGVGPGTRQPPADVAGPAPIRRLAQRAGLVRRDGGRLVVTVQGAARAAQPEALWRAAAGALVATDAFAGAAGEVVLAGLAGGDAVSGQELAATAAEVLAEEGWTDQRRGEPVRAEVITGCVDDLLGLLAVLSLLDGPVEGSIVRLVDPLGRATAREALHRLATAPRTRLFG